MLKSKYILYGKLIFASAAVEVKFVTQKQYLKDQKHISLMRTWSLIRMKVVI